MITEDIDISWKLQRDHWSIFYEPRGLCWILMPETLRGLWKQRLRWAQGGAEVFLKNLRSIWSWRHRRLWPLPVRRPAQPDADRQPDAARLHRHDAGDGVPAAIRGQHPDRPPL
ncbi:hypothetical protein G6F68_015616 [Rhizopus microsporus]|nr:hypothetical protein G6F68_015616 [Rhizopus microsporus]